MYLIPASYDLEHAVKFAYDTSFTIHKNDAAQSEEEDGKPNAGGANKDDKSNISESKT